jgi:hypothetical protein
MAGLVQPFIVRVLTAKRRHYDNFRRLYHYVVSWRISKLGLSE